MRLFTVPLRRYAVSIGLSLLFALGIAYYVLGYLPARENYLQARYFRVMERVGKNMQDKIGAFGKRGEAMVVEIRYKAWQTQAARDSAARFISWGAYQSASEGLAAEWRRAGLNSPDFKELSKDSSLLSFGKLLAAHWQEDGQRLELVYGFEDSLKLTTSTPMESFVQGLLRPDAFAHFLVLGPKTSDKSSGTFDQVYFSTFPAPATLDLAVAKKHHWLRDTTGIQATRQVDLSIGGRAYKLFIQPIRLANSSNATWLLAGAVPAEQFHANRQALPDNLLDGALVLIFLAMLALPYLKIVLMSTRERLSQWDVVLCGGTLVVGTTFLMLVAIAPTAKYSIETALIDRQLQELHAAVRQEFDEELQELNTTLVRRERALLSGATRAALRSVLADSLKLTNPAQRSEPLHLAGPTPYLFPHLPAFQTTGRSWQGDDRMLWLDRTGQALLSIDSFPTHFTSRLHERDYFKQAAQRQFWQLPGAPADSFLLASVVRNGRRGEKTAVFVRPSRVALCSTGDVVAPGAAAAGRVGQPSFINTYSTRLRSLSDPVLPPGYSFCVIDQQGEVLFHSDANLALSENLLKDCEPVRVLQAAVFSGEATQKEVYYQGRRHRLRLEPLGSLPLYLVTLADLNLVQARHLQTLGLAGTLLALLGLTQGIFVGLYVLVLPRPHRLFPMAYRLRRLWPRLERTLTYEQIAAVLAGGAVLLFLFANHVPLFTQLFLLVLLPLYAFIFSFYKLRLPTDNPGVPPPRALAGWWAGTRTAAATLLQSTGALRRVLLLGSGFVLLYNALAIHFLRAEWWALFLYQLLLLGLLVLIPWLGRAADQGLIRFLKLPPEHRAYFRLKRSYALMLLGWVLVLSVLPAVYCYHMAYRAERELQVRAVHITLSHTLAAGRYSAGSLPYLSFFFGTQPVASPAAAAAPKEATVRFRALAATLQPSFDTLTRAQRQAVPYTAATAPNWQVRLSPSTANELTSVDTAPATHQFRSRLSDLELGQHWYWPSDLLKSDATAVADGWLAWAQRLLKVVVLLAGLYAVLYLFARRVFNLDLLSIKSLVQYTHETFPPATNGHQYRLCATDDCYPDQLRSSHYPPQSLRWLWLRAAERTGLVSSNVLHLDCRELVPTADAAAALPESWRKRTASFTGSRIALEYFDMHAHEPLYTLAKAAVVEHLLQQPARQLLIASRVHPSVFTDCGHTRETCPEKSQHQAVWKAGDQLLMVLAPFDLVYTPMQCGARLLNPYTAWQGPPEAQPELSAERKAFLSKLEQVSDAPHSRYAREWSTQLRWFVKVECQALPFLAYLEPELEQLLLDSYAHHRLLHQDNVILFIQQRAQLQFRQLWETLAPAEHYILYDLAQDGLLNGRDTLTIHSLLQKGILLYDQLGLRLVNESFRCFILTGLTEQQALRIEHEARQEASRTGAWAQRSLPFFLLLSACALFIFTTQRGILTQAQTFLTAITAALPLLYRFISLSPFGAKVGASYAPKGAEA